MNTLREIEMLQKLIDGKKAEILALEKDIDKIKDFKISDYFICKKLNGSIEYCKVTKPGIERCDLDVILISENELSFRRTGSYIIDKYNYEPSTKEEYQSGKKELFKRLKQLI